MVESCYEVGVRAAARGKNRVMSRQRMRVEHF